MDPCTKEAAINKICVSVCAIEKALMGDLETRTPGLLEEHRELMVYIRKKRGFGWWMEKAIMTSVLGLVVFWVQEKMKGAK
jgi:hypothetical protein